MNDETKITVSFKNNVGGEAKLEKYKQTLMEINSVLGGLNTGAAKELVSTASSTKSMAKDISTMAKQGNIAFNFTTVRAFGRAIKGLATNIGHYVSQSAGYLENMNLLDVAYNNDTKSATKFVNKLSEMYGLDESWGYRTVGIFKQLANAMGITAEMGSKVSETMTQFAIDVSSLYNIDTNDAVQIITSALAGQTKPARRLGADITMSTLQTTLDNAGIERQVANLSYAEKRLVIIASLLGQVSEANNDWGRTIESVANQTRIMHEQWNRLTRTIGNMLLPIVKKILPYVNAILMVLTEIFSIVASLLGYNEEDFDFFGTGPEIEIEEPKIQDYYGGITDGANKAAKANDNLKKSMMGLRSFDKLNNISSPSSSGAGGSGGGGVGGGIGGGIGGIGPDIMDLANKAMDDYNKKLENVKMRATEIRDKIMEWLGFTKLTNEQGEFLGFKFDHITSGTVLGALAVGGIIYNGVRKILKMAEKLGLIKFPNFQGISKALTTMSKLKMPTFITKLFSGGFSGAVTTLTPIALLLATIVGEFDVIAHNKDVQQKLKDLKDSFGRLYLTLKPLVESALEKLAPIFENIGKALGILWDAISNLIGEQWETFVTTLAFINSLSLDAINDGIQIFCDLIDGDFDAAIGHFLDHIDKMKKNAENFVKGLFDANKIKEKVEDATKKLDDIKKWFDELPEKAGEKAGEMLDNFYEEIKKIVNDKKTRDKYIKQGMKIIGYILAGTLIMGNPISLGIALFTFLWNDVMSKENKEKFKSLGIEILKLIGTGIMTFTPVGWGIKALTNIYDDFKTSIKNKDWGYLGKTIGSKLLNGITNGLSGAVTGTITIGGKFLSGIKKALNLEANGGIFKNGKWQPITNYAAGGLPPVGQMFVAREKGPELVGTINGSTAVMNNNQIVSSVASGVYSAVKSAMGSNNNQQVFNIYLDKNHKIATYTLGELQQMATTNGKPIKIGG